MMNTSKITVFSKVILLMVSALLFGSIFFPMWRIELSAPQYPEGLMLQLHADKIGGDVDIINGLNHYIGMKTLHTEDFVEFTFLPYVFGFFALFALAMVFVAKKKGVLLLFASYILFVALASIDFYRWNYDYGHNLDPNAAIVVPGMAYQPPLIGYKQLLNFGAFSVPDVGGWMMIVAGVLILTVVIKEYKLLKKFSKQNIQPVLFLLLSVSFFGCASDKAVPIKLNSDSCDFCRMSISDGKYGSEVITEKGRVYKFDDISCMIRYCKENSATKMKSFYVHDYNQHNVLIPAENAFFLSGGSIHSPMRGNIIAFKTEAESKTVQVKVEAESIDWKAILSK